MKNKLPKPPIWARDPAIGTPRPLRIRVRIGDVTHGRAPGEGSVTRCRTLFIEEGETADLWRRYGMESLNIGQFLEEEAPVDCMSCLVRAAQ